VSAPGIDDPSNLGWPRTVTAKNGAVEILDKPMRVLTSSMGHTEMLAALIDPSRIVGISRVSADPDQSNIAPLIESMQNKNVQRDAEQIIAKDPDLVIFSSFAKPELIDQLETLGIPVVQTEFDGRIGSIADMTRFMAYVVGEVEQGEKIVDEVERRLKFVADTIGIVPEAEKPEVLMMGYLSKWTGGTGTSYEDVINLAGGINLPSLEFEGNQQIGDEAIVAMNPEILFLAANEVRDNDADNIFLSNPALTTVDAINDNRVFPVTRRYIFNLSHWRVRGVEDMAKMLYPDKFADVTFPDLSTGFR
jgi:iron complex transport system substrate-binding protein